MDIRYREELIKADLSGGRLNKYGFRGTYSIKSKDTQNGTTINCIIWDDRYVAHFEYWGITKLNPFWFKFGHMKVFYEKVGMELQRTT
jgi:hypothetical protein